MFGNRRSALIQGQNTRKNPFAGRLNNGRLSGSSTNELLPPGTITLPRSIISPVEKPSTFFQRRCRHEFTEKTRGNYYYCKLCGIKDPEEEQQASGLVVTKTTSALNFDEGKDVMLEIRVRNGKGRKIQLTFDMDGEEEEAGEEEDDDDPSTPTDQPTKKLCPDTPKKLAPCYRVSTNGHNWDSDGKCYRCAAVRRSPQECEKAKNGHHWYFGECYYCSMDYRVFVRCKSNDHVMVNGHCLDCGIMEDEYTVDPPAQDVAIIMVPSSTSAEEEEKNEKEERRHCHDEDEEFADEIEEKKEKEEKVSTTTPEV